MIRVTGRGASVVIIAKADVETQHYGVRGNPREWMRTKLVSDQVESGGFRSRTLCFSERGEMLPAWFQLSIAEQGALHLKIGTQIYFSSRKGYQLQYSHAKSLWFNQLRNRWHVILACYTGSCLQAFSSRG